LDDGCLRETLRTLGRKTIRSGVSKLPRDFQLPAAIRRDLAEKLVRDGGGAQIYGTPG
jgi:hypothetical protein